MTGEEMSKISIVMTTYNGEKYVLQQLESLCQQIKRPDEVIIRDDLSTDNTVQIVNDFIETHNLEGWFIIRNEHNLGWRNNFFEAAKLATGDIIFFSDQDDIWMDDKLSIMSAAMKEKHMGALYAEKDIIDLNGDPNPSRMEKRSFSGKISRIPFSKAFYTMKTLGCCMCVSREILDKYISLNFPEGGHDSQCGRLALLYSSLWHLERPVINYRIHPKNTSGISADVSFGASTLDKRITEVCFQLKWLERVLLDPDLDEDKKAIISSCHNAIMKRVSYLKGEGVSILELLEYMDYYPNFTMFMGDYAYKHNMNSTMGRLRWALRK